ncbi:MAG: universal stress protein [Burkholderiales bacterium]|nr:universal stress protein [Burkholderiales bacterium]
MTYRDILLCIDNRPSCQARIEATLQLAARCNARVHAVAPTGSLALPGGFGMAPSGELLAAAQDYLVGQARAAVARFEEAARRHGAVQCNALVVEGEPGAAVQRHARTVDLIVAGQREPGDDATFPDPGQLVMQSPRPVLVIPYIGVPDDFPGHAVVAWNGSREACRAVTDALPLLHLAKRTTILALESGSAADGDLPGSDLAAYLAHRGVATKVDVDRSAMPAVGENLLSRLADLGADTLVMGAYGHSRAREWAFGGVTRTVLGSMPIPTLLAH